MKLDLWVYFLPFLPRKVIKWSIIIRTNFTPLIFVFEIVCFRFCSFTVKIVRSFRRWTCLGCGSSTRSSIFSLASFWSSLCIMYFPSVTNPFLLDYPTLRFFFSSYRFLKKVTFTFLTDKHKNAIMEEYIQLIFTVWKLGFV